MRELESHCVCPGKMQIKRKPEKTLGLQCKLTVSRKTAYGNKKKQNNDENKQTNKQNTQIKPNKQKNPNTKTANRREGGECDFQSYHIIRFKSLVFNNNNKKSQGMHAKKQKGIIHSKKKKNKQNVFEKDLEADQLDKDFKIIILKMFEELKDMINKVKKVMYEQNRKNK